MKTLIVNADDFGMSESTNLGIEKAHQEGIVTSTSILANGQAFEHAVFISERNPALKVGVHLNITEGSPIKPCELLSTLTDGYIFLKNTSALVKKYLTRKLSKDEILLEFGAQIQKVFDYGITPTHLDTHMHVQGIPIVFDALLEVAQKYNIKRIRSIQEDIKYLDDLGLSTSQKMTIKFNTALAKEFKYKVRKMGLKTTDSFIGQALSGNFNEETLAKIIEQIPHGVHELMCHPSLEDEQNLEGTSELKALISKNVISASKEAGVSFV